MSIFKQNVVGKVLGNEWIEFKGRDGKTVAYREVLLSINGETAVFRTTTELGEDWEIGQLYDFVASPVGEAKIKVAKLDISSARPSRQG